MSPFPVLLSCHSPAPLHYQVFICSSLCLTRVFLEQQHCAIWPPNLLSWPFYFYEQSVFMILIWKKKSCLTHLLKQDVSKTSNISKLVQNWFWCIICVWKMRKYVFITIHLYRTIFLYCFHFLQTNFESWPISC